MQTGCHGLSVTYYILTSQNSVEKRTAFAHPESHPIVDLLTQLYYDVCDTDCMDSIESTFFIPQLVADPGFLYGEVTSSSVLFYCMSAGMDKIRKYITIYLSICSPERRVTTSCRAIAIYVCDEVATSNRFPQPLRTSIILLLCCFEKTELGWQVRAE